MATLIENAAAIKSAAQAIDAAIVAKGGTTDGGLNNAAAAIAALPSGVIEQDERNDVNLFLPDGTLFKSYSSDGFLALADFPSLPELGGLTAQGWNWSLADAKSYVSNHGRLDIGGSYTTDNGETRLYITIAENFRLTQPLMFGRSGGTGISVDWGDGSELVTYEHTTNTIVTHNYVTSGNYVIRLNPIGGAKLLIGGVSGKNVFGLTTNDGSNHSALYSTRLYKVEFGDEVSLDRHAFYGCESLENVFVPEGIDWKINANGIFFHCYGLSFIVIPKGFTRISYDVFWNCHSLSCCVFPSTFILFDSGNVFYYCHSLKSVFLPDNVNVIQGNCFGECQSFSLFIFPRDTNNINANSFSGCNGVEIFDLRSVLVVPSLSSVSAFGGIAQDAKIVVPDQLFDEWIAETNWSYASIVGHIVKASEYTEA